jgi:imidazolonepropionase-like amidohydrolase/ABC-type multidrug transport system permease subunit
MKPYLALIRNDVRLAYRQKAVIFFNYLMPLGFFFLFAQADHAERGGAIVQVITMVLVIGILGNGLFGGGMRAVQERENNILRRYKVAPISPLPLLVASTVTGLMVYLPLVAVTLVLAHFQYGMDVPQNMTALLVFIVLGLIAIRSIGLIIASVVNSVQESTVLVQIAYMSMLFLSGTTFPISMFPGWLKIVSQFIPATHIVSGLQNILVQNESLAANWQSAGALALTTVVGLLLCVKLFRWEKEEKMKPSAKLWLVAVLIPFVALGGWQVHANDDVRKSKIVDRELSRGRTWLIRNARIFIGDGRVIENGAVLVKNGKIAEVFDGSVPDEKSLNAEPIEAAGKTILPGLIDSHIHLGAPGGLLDLNHGDGSKYDAAKAMTRALAAYLYCGVTAVKSVGDPLDAILSIRTLVNSGEDLGSELFLVGPLFTTPGGHGTEIMRSLPENIRNSVNAQFLRLPQTADEAKSQVDSLKRLHVDGIKAIMEAGAGGLVYSRLDPQLLNAIASEAHADGLPIVVHTGNVRDIEDALKAGVNGIEHGSFRERIPDADFALMKKTGVTYDPTLSVAEALPQYAAGKLDLLNRSLVQQVVPKELLAGTKQMMESPEAQASRKSIGQYPVDMAIARDNLLRAWKAGVTLITGSDAGNMLVFHGPTVQHEIALWVEAGIPPEVALQAATLNSAKALGAGARFGSLEKGKDATMLVVDGNPLQDIHATEAISFVIFKGERVDRAGLFDQE